MITEDVSGVNNVIRNKVFHKTWCAIDTAACNKTLSLTWNFSYRIAYEIAEDFSEVSAEINHYLYNQMQ